MRPDTVHELKKPEFGWRPGTRREQCTFEDLSMNLPLEACCAGMTLTFEIPMNKADPIYLKDRTGNVLFEWERTPSLAEVWEVSRQYLS